MIWGESSSEGSVMIEKISGSKGDIHCYVIFYIFYNLSLFFFYVYLAPPFNKAPFIKVCIGFMNDL